MLADKIKEGKITKKWIEHCLPQEYRRSYAKSEQSSLSRNAKKLGEILVDNEGKSLAESSSYEGSSIDNIAHIAHTQTQGRVRNQTLQKDTPNNLGISENDDDGGCIRGSGMGRSISQSFNDYTRLTLVWSLEVYHKLSCVLWHEMGEVSRNTFSKSGFRFRAHVFYWKR